MELYPQLSQLKAGTLLKIIVDYINLFEKVFVIIESGNNAYHINYI